MKSFILFLFLVISIAGGQELTPLNRRDAIARDLFSQSLTGPSLRREEPLFFQEPRTQEKKNLALAAAYSLLLPGMGEMYAGDYGSGKYFTIAEGSLWIALGSVHWYANWLQNDARSFAVQHANVVLENKADQYFVDIGNFANTYTYNQGALRAREYFKTYNPNSAFAWSWDSDASRSQFRDRRIASDEMFNNTKFIAAVIGLNHLISAINAGRIALAHNKGVDQAASIDLHANLLGTIARPTGVRLTITRHF